jgi:hypothetical protein
MDKDPKDELAAARKRRLKKLVYANLVGASLLSAVGFSASAHGNASSHKGTGLTHSLTWDLDEFRIDQQAQPAGGQKETGDPNKDAPIH